jgi:hypothetical protein
MESQRPLRTTTGNLIHLISNQTEVQTILDAPLPTQDGGKSSELKEDSLLMIKARFLKFKIKKRLQIKSKEMLW